MSMHTHTNTRTPHIHVSEVKNVRLNKRMNQDSPLRKALPVFLYCPSPSAYECHMSQSMGNCWKDHGCLVGLCAVFPMDTH